MENSKQDAYNSIRALLDQYQAVIQKKPENLVANCARLEAIEYLRPALQQCLANWETEPLANSQKLLVAILAKVRDRTKRTALSLFENPTLPENQLVIGVAQWLQECERKSAIELLCPDLCVESAHQKYPDLNEIPLEELFGTFIESSHDGYVIPVKILAELDVLGIENIAPPDNYYYDFMKTAPAGIDTTKLAQSDLKKLFQHSAESEKIAQLQQEYWVLQQEEPSLYANLNLFVKRLKKESVNERGSEFDTGAGAYQLIIDFFEYYDALSAAEKDLVPAQVKEQLRLIHAYSSDPQMNVDALGHQEVQTCTATRSKELEKAIQSSENMSILKTIAVSSQARIRQLEAIEAEVSSLKKAIESQNYRGQPRSGQLAGIIAREEWGFIEVFPEQSYVDSIRFLSPEDIKELFSMPQGRFAIDIRHELKDFFYNENVIDIVLTLNSKQKVQLCKSFKDLIEPGLMNYQKLSYLIQLIGGDNIEIALGSQIEKIIADAKNSMIEKTTFPSQEDPALRRYLQLSKMLMQSNMSSQLKKQLEISDEFLKSSLENNKDHIAASILKIAELPLPRETIKNLVIYAASQPEFYQQMDSFYDLVDIFSKAQLDTEAKKIILQKFFTHTPAKGRNFYLGLPHDTYEVVLKENELVTLIPSSILDVITYNPSWKKWLEKDKELDYAMNRGLLSSLQACFKFNRIFPKDHASKILACADPEKWSAKQPKLKDLNLRDSFELCQIIQYPQIEKYLFSGKRSATFLKDALELDKATYSHPFKRLLMSPRGAVILTHLNSFIKLRIVLSSVDPVLSQHLFSKLAADHIDFLKKIVGHEDDEKTVLKWMKQASLLYRLGLGFLEPAIGYVFGPTRVQQWMRHMEAKSAERLSQQNASQGVEMRQKEKVDRHDLGPSSQTFICLSQGRANSKESHKNKK